MKSNADAMPIPTTEAAPASEAAEASMRSQLAAVAAGDRRAFSALYLHLHPALSRFLARHTGRRELIDEIINEAFWVVWRKAGTFRGDSKVSTWIIGIAYRCMLKLLREQPAAGTSDTGDEPGDTSSNHDAEQRDLQDWLRRGMALLPLDQRTTLELAYYLGQSCEEIASVMDCAVGTVKARLFHARVRLRNNLPALGGDPAGAVATGSPQP